MIVAHPAQVTDPVEEFENLDRKLAAGRNLVAKFGGARGAVALSHVACDVGEFGHSRRQEKVIVRHLRHITGARDGFQQVPYFDFGDAGVARDVTYSRRIEFAIVEQRLDALPPHALILAQRCGMRGQREKCAAALQR